MALPVVAGHPLLMEQGVQRVRGRRERPPHLEVGAEGDDEDPFPLLRDAVVRRVEQPEDRPVLQALAAPSEQVLALQPGEVPGHVLPAPMVTSGWHTCSSKYSK